MATAEFGEGVVAESTANLVPTIEDLKARIISGDIVVPEVSRPDCRLAPMPLGPHKE